MIWRCYVRSAKKTNKQKICQNCHYVYRQICLCHIIALDVTFWIKPCHIFFVPCQVLIWVIGFYPISAPVQDLGLTIVHRYWVKQSIKENNRRRSFQYIVFRSLIMFTQKYFIKWEGPGHLMTLLAQSLPCQAMYLISHGRLQCLPCWILAHVIMPPTGHAVPCNVGRNGVKSD